MNCHLRTSGNLKPSSTWPRPDGTGGGRMSIWVILIPRSIHVLLLFPIIMPLTFFTPYQTRDHSRAPPPVIISNYSLLDLDATTNRIYRLFHLGPRLTSGNLKRVDTRAHEDRKAKASTYVISMRSLRPVLTDCSTTTCQILRSRLCAGSIER